jgi:hypothetical protein
MLHLLMDDKAWFTTHRSRWHSRPVTWQAHLLIATFLLAIIGVEVLTNRGAVGLTEQVAMIVALTLAFMLITWRRTAKIERGG